MIWPWMMSGLCLVCLQVVMHAHFKPNSFYKFIEDDYSHANRTLLQLLLRDQGLVPRLNCLKRCFFLSHSSYLTHFLDLAHAELRKTAKAVSLVKLQSLLDLALGADAHGDDVPFREDVRVTMATTGLYEWLLRIVNVSGVIGDDGDLAKDGGHDEHHKKGKEKDEKKPMLGSSHSRAICLV
jgi:gamma-tubulin complex component 2